MTVTGLFCSRSKHDIRSQTLARAYYQEDLSKQTNRQIAQSRPAAIGSRPAAAIGTHLKTAVDLGGKRDSVL